MTFSNANSATSTATVSAYGTYVLRWTITNGTCNTFDEVTISYAETANAGPDQYKCGTLVATLAGNSASAGTGTWTKTSGPGTVTFSNANSATSTATVSAYGTYVLRWTIVNGTCNTFDEVTVAYAETANAGPDQQVCGSLVATLAGNTPSAGSGLWTKTSGPGTVTFSNAVSATSNATVSAYGTYVFRWTITNGSCNSFDEVTVAYAESANAGPDQQKCGTLVATLAGNSASAGSGLWTKTSGPGTVTFSNSADPASSATVSAYGTYVMRWTITNGTCNTFDEVTITYAETANAGPDQNICGALAATLAANSPSAGTGTWTKTSGPGTVTFSNANSATSTATVSAYGTYVLRWTILNGSCNTFDEMTVAYAESANAGPDQNICGSLAATLAANTPSAGTGTWTKTSGPGTVTFSNANSATSTATVSAYGTYVLRWTITNGTCNTFDEVTISYAETANAGPDQYKCGTLVATLAGNSASAGTGTWTKTSGPGTVTFSNANSATSTATVSAYGTYVLRWTIVNGTCNTFDEVTVAYAEAANAGPDQALCSTLVATLAGNTASAGTGLWTKTTGPGTVTFSNANSAASTATVSAYGTYVLRWTITNGSCNSFDEVTVSYEKAANAGPAQDLCNTLVATLAGNTAAAGTGTWTLVSGPGTVIFTPDANTATASATVSQYGTYVFKWTISNGGVCSTNQNVTVNYNPAGQVDQPSGQTLCNGASTTAITFTTTNSIGTTTYSWTNSVPGIGLAASGTGNIASFIAANSGSAPVVATIVVTPALTNGPAVCVGSSKSFTITVNPTPALTTTLTPADVCSNTAFSYVPASATAGTTFSWTRAVVAGITPAGPTSGTNNPNETLRNITSGPIAVTYQYTLAANSCSNVQNVVVNIRPEPVITSGQTTAACSGNALNYAILMNNFTNPADNVTFTWPAPALSPVSANFSGGTARAVASSANITDTYLNTTGLIGTATYTVTPFKNGCAGTPVTVVVGVGSQPVLDPGLNAFACSNTPTGLTLKVASGSVAPTYYNISSVTMDAGLTAGSGNAVIPNTTAPAGYLAGDVFVNFTGVNKNVTYHIQPILAPNCIGNGVDVVITIRPQPVVVPGQTKTVCSRVPIGKEIFLIPANTPAGTTFSWGLPLMSDASVQGTAGLNVAADPAGTVHINDAIHNYSSAPITATYTVTPTSQFGCIGTAVPVIITIDQEPVPQAISGRANLCSGDKNVVYDVNAVGGSTFHWTVDPAVGTKTFDFNTNAILINAATSAGTGNISVYETNSLGCSGDPSTLPVTVYTQPVAENITGSSVVCALSTHVYSVTNRAGSVYSWTIPGGAALIGDPSANSVTILFGITGGTILVRETNIAGCVTNHNPLSVTVDPLPVATISNGGTMCDGGTRPLNVAFTGIAPFNFTYAINGVSQVPVATSSNPYTINATVQGTYTIVNVTDNTGCTNTGSGSAIVTFFPKPTGIISGTAEMCRGNSATLTMTFTGVAPFTFTYTDGTTPVTVTANPSNVYTVGVSPLVNSTYTLTSLTDFNNCAGVLSGSAVITVNQPPSLSLTGTNLTCYKVSTGAVDLTISGGTSPFGISWTGPDGFTSPTEDISGLEAGYYAVTVIDSKGCTASANITLTQPPALNAAVAGTNITCFGANDGTITISGATGGAGTYGYTIDGGTTWVASGTFTGLAPGTYNVQMRDAVNTTCTLTLNSALVLTGPAVLSATVTKTDITCFGANNGSIVISSPAGGYGTYQYSINGGTTWLGSGNFTNLSAGSYNIRIRDAVNTGCVIVLNPALVISEPTVLSATVSSTNITCFGSTDGTITISSPSGGHGTYEYSINGGGSWQGSGSYTALTPGTYNVQIRDASYSGCYIVLNGALVLSKPAGLNALVSSSNVTCNGANDGTITISSPTGGYGTYEYTVNGGTTWVASGSFSGVTPGTYDVRIRDAAHTACSVILNGGLQITEPDKLTGMVVTSNISCFGANDGVITITNSAGGYGTYQYSINGGTSWQNLPAFSPLTPGVYNVMMRDRTHTGCVVTLNNALQITEPAVLNAVVTSANVTCNGANDGAISITAAAGGSGNYQFSINGGSTWQLSGSFTGITPGTYNVIIRDAVNTACLTVLNPALVITQPAILAATAAGTNVTCNGANDGIITITSPTGGYGTYEYTVDGGTTWQTGGSFTALAPGFYNVRIRDAAHTSCVVTMNGSLRITEPPVLTANVTSTNVTCNGAGNGTITISSPAGGYGTYEYSINGGTAWQGSGSYINLTPGTYVVMISDAAHTGCTITLNPALVITQPAVLNAAVTSSNVTCFGANDGTISVSGATGGYGTYQYTVNGGTTWQGFGNFSNLAPGTYNVRIRDAFNTGCVIVLNPALVITQPAALSATISATNVTCFGGNDGTITISGATGGYGTYEYSINGGGSWQASGSFAGLTPGTYNILIRDAAHTSCIIVLNNAYIITQPGILSATVNKTDVSCHGDNDGSITITSPSGGYGTYEYSSNGGVSWQASGSFTNLAPGTYDIRIRDAVHKACSAILYPNMLITEPVTLTMSSTGNIVLNCNGDMDGIGTFYASGGTMPYSFLVVSNTTGGTVAPSGFNSQTFFNAGAGSITLSVVDHNGCSAQSTINVTQPAVLNPGSISADQVICSGDNPAALTENSAPTGGSGSYTFQWQQSTNAAGPFVNIAGATSNVYTPLSGAIYTLYYRRMVTSGVCVPLYSNVVEVLVNPLPVALLTGGETICPGQSSVLKVNLLAGTGPFTIVIDNLGTVNGYASGTDIVVTPATTTTYKLLSVKDANNCEVVSPSASLNGTATVVVGTLPSITSFTPSPAVCEFTLAKFSVTATGTNLSYQWYVNDGTGFSAAADGGTYFGALTPTLQIFNSIRSMNGYIYHVVVSGCGSSVTSADAVFTVNTAPEITLHPKDSTVCLGNNAVMQADADGTSLTWQWYVNKGAGFVLLADDPNFSGSTTKTLTITNALASFNNWIFRAKATGVCGVPVYTNFAALRVINPPVVTVQPVSKTVCANGQTTFLGNGTGYSTLQWQVFSGGSWIDLADDATYIGTGTQQLAIMSATSAMNGNQYRLALVSACTVIYSSSATLTVNANPVVDFSAVSPIAACGGVPLVINGNPTGGSGTYTLHRWTGDVGPLNNYFIQSPVFNTQISGNYNLNYKVTDSNGCTANGDVTVTVDSPSALFTDDAEYGCTPLPVTFTKDMTGISKWWWNFGDGSPVDSVNASPVHTFTNTVKGSIEYYNANLTVQSPGGCKANYSVTITVYPTVDATFTANPAITCSGSSITFTAISGASKYYWNYGDGVSGYGSYVSSHLYTNLTTSPVVDTVKLTTTSFYNCTDVKTLVITVMPVPLPEFTASPVSQVYNSAGNPVTFTNATNAGTWNWLWRFGDNSTSTDMNPVHTYNNVGDYPVTLIASNANCSDSIKHDVSVVPPAPVALFDSIPSGCAPLYVVINNTSQNTDVPGTTYKWDFGDGSTSTAKNPTYTYFTPGTYRIELTITGPGGTSNKSQVVSAYDSPKAYFELSPAQVYVNDEQVRFFNLSQNANSYLWNFGDGDTTNVAQPFHRYMEEGVYDITLWAYSSNGCSDKYVLSPGVTVIPNGNLRFSTVFMPNKTGPIERTDLPTGGTEVDQFFYPPIRQKVLKYKLQIFNRWGVLIFQSDDINVPWNGYYKGQLCQQGVYVWYVEGKYQDGKPFKMVGDVTLLQ